tara:strand:- start:18943 stop:19128 length:186 start_codon:yes stop_codon:yes gene_type:complete
MNILIESKELGIILGTRKSYKGVVQYVVMYGYNEHKTTDFVQALEEFKLCATRSAECEGML